LLNTLAISINRRANSLNPFANRLDGLLP
jgi:hypothetical protein